MALFIDRAFHYLLSHYNKLYRFLPSSFSLSKCDNIYSEDFVLIIYFKICLYLYATFSALRMFSPNTTKLFRVSFIVLAFFIPLSNINSMLSIVSLVR